VDIEGAFEQLQAVATADPDQASKARERRDLFRTAFEPCDDVVEVVPSGSLARKTQRDPINDVDLVIVFDPEQHPDWGEDGESAGEALEYLKDKVRELLGSTEGTVANEVRLAKPRNHAVKCFLDDPQDPDAFTVDVMPALRHADGHLIAPERESEEWIETDPEFLIGRVEARQEDWEAFIPLVRVLKMWNQTSNAGMKSLAVEVLALELLPPEPSLARAVQRFFSAAELRIEEPIEDPAGRCGEIDPDLDVDQARSCLANAASAAWKACDAQDVGETDRAACLWREVFGAAFPEPEGGCEDSASGGNGVGVGVGIGVGIGVGRPRPVRDAPQGAI